jgi:hypothetical protein
MASSKKASALRFVAVHVGKGALQAVGALVIYMLVLWVLFAHVLKGNDNALVARALAMKAPGLAYQYPQQQQQQQQQQPQQRHQH